mmetsp:Transcript_26105/g.29042  ORF Transcript_26105/g.29042 Transcript_26105/m.29042 type:complete len:219 (+) Transcript_26105:111-767(+)
MFVCFCNWLFIWAINGSVISRYILCLVLGYKCLPVSVGLFDYFNSEFLWLRLVIIRKDILWFAVRDLVVAQELEYLLQFSWVNLFDIFELVNLAGLWVVDVNGNNFPVSLAFVNHSVNAYYFDGNGIASVMLYVTNLANVQRIVITFSFSALMGLGRVLPCLWDSTIVEWVFKGYVAQFSFLSILLDWVERLVTADLEFWLCSTWNLYNHGGNSIGFV